MKDNRKMLFTALLSMLFVLSNIVAFKVTVIAKLPIPCNVFVYPFMFLCVAIITYLYGAKDGRKSIYFALIAQVIFYVMSIIIVNLPNQVDTIVNANYIQATLASDISNGIYYPSIKLMLGSLIAFVISQMINVGLMAFSKKYTFKGVAAALSMLFSTIVFAIMYTIITGVGNVGNPIALRLINQFVVCVVIAVISVILFCIFTIGKAKEEKNKKTTK